jgi:DNA-3-methyladenine glycosylase II
MMRTFMLEPLPPFRLDLTALALRRRADNTIDRWDGRSYRRVLLVSGEPVVIDVAQTGAPETPRLQATLNATTLAANTAACAARELERLLGLRCDLADFYRLAAGDTRLGPLAAALRGFKPPRFPSVFEALVNGIACQQVTLTLGIRLLGRLAERYGVPARWNSTAMHAFPRPEDLARVPPQALRTLGFSTQKARAITELAHVIIDGHLDVEALSALSDDAAIERLCELRGVGRWTAEYVLLRGLGRLHMFPADDLGARNNLQRWLELAPPLDSAAVRRRFAVWSPYGGLVYLHLLLQGLLASEAGATR